MHQDKIMTKIRLHSRSVGLVLICLLLLTAGVSAANRDNLIRLIILDPGHGHATFMQGAMDPSIDPVVHVYAPPGPDVQTYLNSITRSNTRQNNPTSWKIVLYAGDDYLEKMIADKKGNAVVISGNNKKKPEYISRSIAAGFNVLADKPMAITDFRSLENSFDMAVRQNVLLFDSMDLRYDINSILQRELSQIPELFGVLQKGSEDSPALVQSNLHHYLKYSSGQSVVRPAWFFDIDQQGRGIVDVSTHLVDLNQWLAFPGVAIDYKKDLRMISSREWDNKLTPSEFRAVTKTDGYPDFLMKDVKDSILSVMSNGEIRYIINGVHAKVSVLWRYKEPQGSSDTRYSLMRGTKASLELRQGEDEQFKATLYIKPADGIGEGEFEKSLQTALQKLQTSYPGTEFQKRGSEWIVFPGKYTRTNATSTAIEYLKNGRMPDWEVPNMLSKYWTTLNGGQWKVDN